MTGISVLIASGGRRSLRSVVSLIAPQLNSWQGDELMVDCNSLGGYGHPARNLLMYRAKAENLLWFLDDDDRPEVDAVERIRRAAADDARPHVFRMMYAGSYIWQQPAVTQGNVSTQMIVVPQYLATASRWGDRYEGDFDFMVGLQRTGVDFAWHDTMIVEHNGLKGAG